MSGPVLSLVEGKNDLLLSEVARLYLTPQLKIADLTWGKGVFWRKCPDLDVTGSDIITVPERPWDLTSTPYEDESFDVTVLDPPYIHSPGKHYTSGQYQGQTVQGKSMKDILRLYRDGLVECKRITKHGGRILVKTKDTIEHGKQVWSHVHIHNDATRLDLYAKDLFLLKTQPPAEQRWKGSTQKHSRKNVSYLWVFEKNRLAA